MSDAADKSDRSDPAQGATDRSEVEYRERRRGHWDEVARRFGADARWGRFYHRRLAEIYRLLVPPGRCVLELGCGAGDLLAALEPSEGVGVDFSGEMIRLARQRHPGLRFVEADAHCFEAEGTFDAVVLSDLINDLWDIQGVFERLRGICTPRTRVVLNFYSRLWQWGLGAARRVGMARPVLPQNWLTPHDVAALLDLAGFEVIRRSSEVLCPVPIPGVAGLCNRVVVKLWPWWHAALTNVLVARPQARPRTGERAPSVSVIVPARNEAGNMAAAIDRTPGMAGGTEIIIVEGGSTDDTYAAAERAIAARPDRRCRLMRQTGRGKGDAVRMGFATATGDIVMILDADLTVAPEDLSRFVEALRSGRGEFINGVRLVYPMQAGAMRLCNLAANKFFGWAFSWLLGQPVKDTLCGTKALWRDDYERIAAGRAYFGTFDPFGDFDLLFGAAKQTLKILDLPIRYRERTYGQTNISRWREGPVLLRMCGVAARRLKFV